MKKISATIIAALTSILALSATSFDLKSPDGKIVTQISNNDGLTFSVSYDNETVLAPSQIGLTLADGTVGGVGCKLSGAKRSNVDKIIEAPLYRSEKLRDHYNQLSLNLGKDWSIIFRAYNDAVAYRFVKRDNNPDIVVNETAEYRFNNDGAAYVPYAVGSSTDNYEDQFFNSFENIYTNTTLTQIDNRRLMFLPLVVEAAPGKKVLFTEVDLLDYPGMYLTNPTNEKQLKAVFAPYPKEVEHGGYNNLQGVVKSHEDFIAKLDSSRALPWRAMVFSDDDKNLAATDITYLLAEPSRIKDISWIKPGKVAWDWWNAWNLEGVDFETGVNNDTYKAYIDFASKHGIEYVILDEGWAVNKKADLRQIVPEIDLKELADYGAERNVGLILWAGYKAFENNMEENCKFFSDLGIKGYKIDFMNRDDQPMTEFYRRAAETAAKYNQVIDFHGAYKPAGFTRTYPNVLNHEGVHGLETMKWSPDVDEVEYDVMLPFIRQVAGPMDYTQGAMHNASQGNFRPINSEPMSQGTRCRQLALYMVLDSPLNMLCDSPSNYEREPECTEFISAVPTVWDETIVLDGKMGDYIITARRSGDTWYIGGLTDWTPRDLTLDFSFLTKGQSYTATIFKDGVNAHRKGTDYKKVTETVTSDSKINIHLAPGGGFAVVVKPVEPSVVYMTREISPEAIVKLYKALGREAHGKVAVKISTGEPGGHNFLQPSLIAPFVKLVNGTIVECNTAYAGKRFSTEDHLKAAEDHGFTAIAPVDIMDADGEVKLPLANGKHLKYDIVGSHYPDYDFTVILSHFKGHAMGGFGGAVKNMSIGIGSSNGKSYIHSAGKIDTTEGLWSNLGAQDDFLESMAEAAKAIADHAGDNIIYINVANNLSVDCDCDSHPADPQMHDLGVLASLDPIALDKACTDLVRNSSDHGKIHLIERIDSRHGMHTLDYGQQIGLGSQNYKLVNLD